MLKIIFFALLAFSAFAYSDTYPVQVGYKINFGPIFPTRPEACTWFSAGSVPYYVGSNWYCKFTNGTYDGSKSLSDINYCPYGGSVYGTSCINAPSCPTGQTRNATTGACESPVVACNTAGTTTTNGSTQTFTWETSATGFSPCDPHSFTCDYPLAVNSTDKRCDLTCPDGSTVNVSAGEQCSHDCPNQVNGSIITLRTWDELTQQCVNSGIKQCDRQLQIADVLSGDCLPKPGVKDCGNGIVVTEPVECSSKPDDSQMIICPDGLKIYPPRVCNPLPPSKEDCHGGTPGFMNGVPVCYGADGTASPAPNGTQTPSTDKYNPQQYKAGVACNSSYSYPCDPSLPVNTSLDINPPETQTCGPGTFFTCADAHSKPILPELYPKAPTPTNTETTSTSTSTNTTNIDGSVTTTTTTTGSSTTFGSTTTNCPDCAKESTLREVVNRLGGKAAGSNAGSVNAGMGTFQARGKNTNPDLGKWYEPTEDTYESVLQSNVDAIKNSPIMSFGKDIFSVSIPSGSCPTWTFPSVMGMPEVTVSPLCAEFMDNLWSLVSAVIQACAVFMAFRIALTGLA